MISKPFQISGYEFCFEIKSPFAFGDPFCWLFDFKIIELDKYNSVSVLTVFGLQIGFIKLTNA